MKFSYAILLCSLGSASAFVAQSSTPLTPHSRVASSLAAVDRRRVLETGVATLFIGASSLSPAFALENSSEPTAEEKEAAEKAAYEERLRRKAELQQQKGQSNNFSAGMKAELAKQKEMNSKSKEQRRNDLCEELGRGC